MNSFEIAYLRNQIENHLLLFFSEQAQKLFNDNTVRILPFDEAIDIKEMVIAIPNNIPVPQKPENVYRIKFNNTELTLWNRIAPPANDTWKALPDESAPLWYQNKYGTLIPAWNLFGNLFKLLTFDEEKEVNQKDRHGRFIAAYSPRLSSGLLEVPTFNEAVAAVIAGLLGLQSTGQPEYSLKNLLNPPVVTLSHDCDILTGNDFWTQSVRAYRVVLPLARLRFPKVDNIWWIIRNAFSPHKYYFDNVLGMIDIERCFGFNSTFYLLNGNGGRFGARSGLNIIPELLKFIPPDWDVGVHYNYDTFLDDVKFESQLSQLRSINKSIAAIGRAHYLRFDPFKSFSFLQKHGINVDESSGYADRIGYRNGIAGCFQPYDPISKKAMDIWEVPITVMDAVMVKQYGGQTIPVFSKLINHLGRIGGTLTVIFHPGQFNNPEFMPMLGVYHKMLVECRDSGAVSKTARALAAALR